MIYLRAITAGTSDPQGIQLPLGVPPSSSTVSLRCLSGASGVHVVLSDGNRICLRAEIPAHAQEVITIFVDSYESGELSLCCPGKSVVTLSSDSRYDPAPPILPMLPAGALDLVFLVDGTALTWPPNPYRWSDSSYLLDNNELWKDHVWDLVSWSEAIAPPNYETRFAVLAFGDKAPPEVSAPDLMPNYLLFPEPSNVTWQPHSSEKLAKDLLSLHATPGGDFVDALADGLAACAQLEWRPQARKLLVLTGGSPGFSISHPAPKGGNTLTRTRDVDTEAMVLQRLGVEVMTIYHKLPVDIEDSLFGAFRELIDFARTQYARLASLPDTAFLASAFDVTTAAAVIRYIISPIGRGAALGEFLSLVTNPPTSESTSSTLT